MASETRSAESSNHNRAKMHAAFEDYLNRLGLRQTKQRKIILDAVLNLGPHVDAETISLKARSLDSSIGLATVYRALQLLTNSGLLVERQFGRDRTQFEVADAAHEHHDHLICNQCGTIIEFFDADLESLQDKIGVNLGFKLTKHRMEMYGDCQLDFETCPKKTSKNK